MQPELRALDEYVLHYIVSGSGYYRDAHYGKIALQPGDVVINYPGRLHEFNPLPGKEIELYYTIFQGQMAEELFHRLDGDARAVFPVTFGMAYEHYFTELMELSRTGVPYHRDRAHAILYALIVETLYLKKGARLAPGQNDICARYMAFARQHLHEPALPLHDFFARENTGHEAFRKRFRHVAGQSPHAYWLAQKIAAAKEMLFRDEHTTVQEIAQRLGFTDPFYFSRLFKTKTGSSPSHFRARSRRFLP